MNIEFKIITENPIFADVQSGRGQKRLKSLYKKGMKNAMESWHKRNIKKHFSRYAVGVYRPYSRYYGGSKKKIPLVWTGTLKKNITSGIKVSMPNKGMRETAVGKMRIGRPGIVGTLSKEDLEILIKTEVKKSKSSWAQAKRKVLQKNSYSKKSKARFQELIGFLNKTEKKAFAQMVLDYVVKNYKFPKKKRKTVKRIT